MIGAVGAGVAMPAVATMQRWAATAVGLLKASLLAGDGSAPTRALINIRYKVSGQLALEVGCEEALA